jgi:cytochrome c
MGNKVLCLAAIFGCSLISPSSAQDLGRGRQQFERRCLSCHSAAPGENRVGPTLFGAVGRLSGSVAGFNYSSSYVEAGRKGLIWLEPELNDFLQNPAAFLRAFLQQKTVQTRMTARVQDNQERADLIAYLKSLNK